MAGFTARRRMRTRHRAKGGSKEKAGLVMANVAPASTPKNKRKMIYFVTKQGHLMAKPMNRKGGKKGRVGVCHPGKRRRRRR